MLKLHDVILSGNCHKVRLMLSLLGLEYAAIPVNLQASAQKSASFLKLNPLGQVPVLVDGDIVIRDAQAILVYLARRYGSEEWLPIDAQAMSKVVQWLSTAANDIQTGLAAVRRHFLLGDSLDVVLAQRKAHQILQIIDARLSAHQWLECDRPTIADIACFPYVGLAADAKIDLVAYPHTTAWIERIKQLPGYVGMPGL